jgi:hypothetical protein
MNEPRLLLRDTLLTLAGQPVQDLAQLVEHPRRDLVSRPSGGRYRIKSSAFWDIEAWDSFLYVEVRVFEASGWRSRFPHKSGLTVDPDSGEVFPHRNSGLPTDPASGVYRDGALVSSPDYASGEGPAGHPGTEESGDPRPSR